MSETIDNSNYAKLLNEILPRPIKTESAYKHYLKIVENLMSRKEADLSTEEFALLELLAILIEDFDEKCFPQFSGNPTPLELLNGLLSFQPELTYRDFANIFSSEKIFTDVLEGRREITVEEGLKLSRRFSINPDAFI